MDKLIKQINTRKQNLIHKTYSILFIALFILCGSSYLIYKKQLQLIESTSQLNKYILIPITFKEILSTVKDSRTGLYQYNITNDSAYLKSIEKFDEQLALKLNNLKIYLNKMAIDTSTFNLIAQLSTENMKLQQKFSIEKNIQKRSHLFEEINNNLNKLERLIEDNQLKGKQLLFNSNIKQNTYINELPYYILLVILSSIITYGILSYFVLQYINKLIRMSMQLVLKYEEINNYNKELDHYTFAVNHHLKEPIRKIRLFISKYLKVHKEQRNENIWLEKADSSASKAQMYLSEFVSYSKMLNNNNFDRTLLKTNEMINDVMNDLNNLITEKKAVINVEKLNNFFGNENYIKLLWYHLIHNSLTYTNPNGHPIINIIENIEEDSNYYSFSIIDNGIGIETKYIENIFKLFHKIHPDNSYTGIGMGLTIVKRVIELHKGKIYVYSNNRKGTEIKLLIPKKVIEIQENILSL